MRERGRSAGSCRPGAGQTISRDDAGRLFGVNKLSCDNLSTDGLIVRGLSARYGQARALFDVSIHVPRGSIIGLVGHNGAGKSTLLNSISRVHGATSGEISLDGENITKLRPDQLSAREVHLVREGAPVFTALSIDEHIELGDRLARIRGKTAIPKGDVWAAFPELVTHRRKPAGILSGGQRQLLCLAIALASRPSVLLLDEPSVGLSPAAARRVFSAIRQLHLDNALTLLIAEQRMDLLQQMTNTYYVMSVGRIVEQVGLGEKASSHGLV